MRFNKIVIFSFFLLLTLTSCSFKASKNVTKGESNAIYSSQDDQVSYTLNSDSNTIKSNNPLTMQNEKNIYLAGGCFWGMQAYFEGVEGVLETDVGYANANIPKPRYEDVDSDYAETIRIRYDASKAPLQFLLELYFDVIDPTLLNRQGNDIGRQYRTGIYFKDPSDEAIAKTALEKLQKKYTRPVVVECIPLKSFYPAEPYHQQYLRKNPGGYCHISRKKINAAKEARYIDKEGLRERLSPMAYQVTQENGTEPPFRNAYFDHFEKGIYVDVVSGEPLFLSSDKYESGCGWPAFAKPIREEAVQEKMDTSHGMIRTEVRSRSSNSHLGHLFDDGPQEHGGLRYCINSAALRFVPLVDMKKEGYEELIPLVE